MVPVGLLILKYVYFLEQKEEKKKEHTLEAQKYLKICWALLLNHLSEMILVLM